MKERGFTLMETMFALMITTGIIFAVTSFGKDILSVNQSASQSLSAGLESRQAIKVMVRELRSLKELQVVATSSISFLLGTDSIRYFLDIPNRALKREVNGAQSILVSDIVSTSTPIFDYYDESYAGTTTPLSLPTNLTDISLVRITFSVDKNPNRPPPPLVTTSQVNLRNLKSNL